MVSDGGSRGFLLVCYYAAVKSLEVAIIMPVTVSVGIMSLWGNQETIYAMRTELVEEIQILWQRYCSRTGTLYHPERVCEYHEPWSSGRPWRRTLIPGGAIGVWSYLKLPNNCAWADNVWLVLEGWRMFRLIKDWATNLHYKLRGKFGSVEHKSAINWFLKVWISFSSQLRRWRPEGINW